MFSHCQPLARFDKKWKVGHCDQLVWLRFANSGGVGSGYQYHWSPSGYHRWVAACLKTPTATMIGANKASERHFLGHFDGRFWVLRHNLTTIFSNQRSVPSRFASRFKRQAGLVWFPNRFKNISSDSEEFACKPEVVVPHSYVVARPGWNATLQVRLVLRMIWMIVTERSTRAMVTLVAKANALQTAKLYHSVTNTNMTKRCV